MLHGTRPCTGVIWQIALLAGAGGQMSLLAAEPSLPDKTAALAAVKALVADAAKSGKTIEVWVKVFREPEKVQLAGADEKALSVKLQGNVVKQDWEKLSADEIAGIAKHCVQNDARRALTLADYCLAWGLLGKADEALSLTAQLDASLSRAIAERMALIQAQRSAGAPKPAVAAPSADGAITSAPGKETPAADATPPGPIGNTVTPIPPSQAAAGRPVRIGGPEMEWPGLLKPEQLPPRYRASTDKLAAVRLKEALLQWCSDNASLCEKAGRKDEAVALRADAEKMKTQEIGLRRAVPPDVFPPFPKAESNPFVKHCSNYIDSALEKGNMTVLARVLCHPQSPRAGEPTLLAALLPKLDDVFNMWSEGKNLGDQFLSPVPGNAYLMLSTVHPDLIPPSKRRKWEAAIGRSADTLAQSRARDFLSPNGHGNVYFDAFYCNALYRAARILNKPDYIKSAEGALKVLDRQLLPDGGFEYIESCLPILFYHGLATTSLADIWTLTGSPLAKELLIRQWWYFPITPDDHSGTDNYSMSPHFKQFGELWHRGQEENCFLIAGVSGSRENYSMAQKDISKGGFWGSGDGLFLAPFYREDLQVLPIPDNYITYDRNIMGPRGHLKNFHFAGNGNSLTGLGKQHFIGIYSYVGMTVFQSQGKKPKNDFHVVALQGAGSEIRNKAGKPQDDVQRDTHYRFHESGKVCTSVLKDVAALTGNFVFEKAEAWAGEEQWLFTTERLVGLVSVAANADQKAYGVDGILKFMGNPVRELPPVETLGENAYQFGGINIHFVEHNYGAPKIETLGDNGRRIARIMLLDPKAAAGNEAAENVYPRGTCFFYLVELRPENSAPAAARRIETGNALAAFDVREERRWYVLIHNPTDVPLPFQRKLDWGGRRALPYQSGARYRPEWMNTYVIPDQDVRPRPEQWGAPEQKPVPVPTANMNVTIPPHAHLLLVSAE
ncbi:MAG: hypothetical protein NTW87_05795 [Planctomycetota bacterium]|nr:hypothetical protein [Planctomycetota bacterium]